MTKKYEIIFKYIQDLSVEISNAETFVYSREFITKYSLGINITSNVIKNIGIHPQGGSVDAMTGKFGDYVKWNKINVTIPKDLNASSISLDQAIELIDSKMAKKK